jgi:NAD(P)H-flavin reductase
MTTRESQATIERVRRISSTLQRIDLGVEEGLARLKPGQSLLARSAGDRWDPYLPEVWTPVALDGLTITIERPARDQYTPGQVISLLGPVGAPFPMRYNLRSLLMLALDTPPTPLVLLATMAVRTRIEVTLVLNGSATDYPLDVLPAEIEVVTGGLEEGWPNQVTTVGWADQVIAVANPRYRDMLYPQLIAKIKELRTDLPKRFVLGLFEGPIPCGTGACQGCGVACVDEDRLICVDGPAIDLEDVKFG